MRSPVFSTRIGVFIDKQGGHESHKSKTAEELKSFFKIALQAYVLYNRPK
jgi:hypothetical protein